MASMIGRGKEERKQSDVAACDKAKESITLYSFYFYCFPLVSIPLQKKQLPQLLKADDVCTKH